MACAPVGVNLETISLDEVMSVTQDRHQSAAGQRPAAPAILALNPLQTKLQTTKMSLMTRSDLT